jgi:hypothetical protein
MHQKHTKHGRFCKQNNQLPTKSHDELKDNYYMGPELLGEKGHFHVHPKLRSITHVETKVHVILWSFIVLTWMRETT